MLKNKQCQAIVDLFAAGKRRTTGQISLVGGRSHTRRISDLRELGHIIEVVGRLPNGDREYEYQGMKTLREPYQLDLIAHRNKHPRAERTA